MRTCAHECTQHTHTNTYIYTHTHTHILILTFFRCSTSCKMSANCFLRRSINWSRSKWAFVSLRRNVHDECAKGNVQATMHYHVACVCVFTCTKILAPLCVACMSFLWAIHVIMCMRLFLFSKSCCLKVQSRDVFFKLFIFVSGFVKLCVFY
jgi:hypothetical protein